MISKQLFLPVKVESYIVTPNKHSHSLMPVDMKCFLPHYPRKHPGGMGRQRTWERGDGLPRVLCKREGAAPLASCRAPRTNALKQPPRCTRLSQPV